MAKLSLFQQLTRLFRSGPLVKRKVKSIDTTLALPESQKSSGALLMQRSQYNSFANMATNAYSLGDRLARYADFQEMELTPELAAALDLYADECVSPDEKNRVLHVYSDNEKIRQELYELFYQTLAVEFNLRHWVRNLVKYGDVMLLNDVHPDHGLIGAHLIPLNEITREEGYDPQDPFAVRFRWESVAARYLENWEVAHFRLLGNDAFLPYGSSIVEPARRIWRQLTLAEDAMLVYRVTRAPERRVYYVDVGNLPSEAVEGHMEEQKRILRSSQVVDANTGRVDQRYNAFGIDEDYYLAVRGQDSGTRIETLAGGQNTAAVEDVIYLRDKLFTAIKVPKAYLNYSDSGGCFPGEQRVPLLNGNVTTFAELASFDWSASRDDVWVYACDVATGEFRPGRVVKAWETKRVRRLVEVALDDGSSFRCTEEHPIIMRDGSERRAVDLLPDDSVMPLYRRSSVSKKNDGDDFIHDYDMVLNNATNEWEYTHKVVYREICNGQYVVKKQRVIHHRDNWKNPEYRAKYEGENHWSVKRKLSAGYDIDWLRRFCVENNVTSINQWRSDYQRSISDRSPVGSGYVNNLIRRAGFANWKEFKKTLKYNHRVIGVSIVELDTEIPVYDIEVENWSTFAIENHIQGCDDNQRSWLFVHNSKASLAQLDIRFSRTIQFIQKTVVSELNKMAMIHLYTKGYREEDILNFTLHLSNPSTVATQQKLELWRTRFEIAGLVPVNVASRRFIRQEIWGLSKDECDAIDNDRYDEHVVDQAVDAANTDASAELGGGGGGGGEGASSAGAEPEGSAEPSGEEKAPEAPEGPETAGTEPAGDLIVSVNDVDDPEFDELKEKIDTTSLPSRIAKHVAYNRSRRRHHGPQSTETPNLARMTGNETPSTEDPYDRTWMKSVVSNPLADAVNPSLSSDMRSLFEGLERSLQARRTQRVPSEGRPQLVVEAIGQEPSDPDAPILEIVDDD